MQQMPYVEALVRADQVVVTMDAPRMGQGCFEVRVPDARTVRVRVAPDEEIQVPLPVDVRQENLSATLLHGVLELQLARL